MSRKKLTEKTKLSNKAEKLWKELIKLKATNRCELCRGDGRQFQMHIHHIERKQSHYMRSLLDNGICLCANCHKWGIHDTSYSRQKEISDKLLRYKGQKFMDNLKRLKNNPPKITELELEERIVMYEDMLQKFYKDKTDKYNV